jgi:Flp pilus assembly protein TadD
VNRNDLRAANEDFRNAYKLDPNNAFTLNNIGYVSELEGDRETAQFFYDRARQVGGANATVGVATRRTEEGRKLFAVAADSNENVEAKVIQDRNALRRQNEPVVLRRRDNSIVDESVQPPAPTDSIQPLQ